MLEKQITRFAELGAPIGIHLHPGKGKLLLPSNAPDQENAGLLALTTVVRTAVRDTGGHVGLDHDVRAEAKLKAESIKPLHDAIRLFGTKEAQPAYRLNAQCAISKMSYYYAVTPVRLVQPTITIFFFVN